MKSIWLTLVKPNSSMSFLLFMLVALAIFLINHFGYMQPIRDTLESDFLSYTIGEVTITLYTLLKMGLTVFVLLWLAGAIISIGEKKLCKSENGQSLTFKIFQISIYVLLFIVGSDIIGLDITTLTVFSGAIGIGLGFGLQKITANFISGLILLKEKSIEEGDMIDMNDDVSGFVRKIGSRYTLIESYNGKEIMVPNEDFITNKVTNWTFSHQLGRVDIPVGVSYQCDIEKALELAVAAARSHPQCIQEPGPSCFVREFADSSINLLLLFWVNDVAIGRYGPKSDVMIAIFNEYKKHNIEIPFPQRDVTILNPSKP